MAGALIWGADVVDFVLPPGHFLVAAVPAITYLIWQDRRLPGVPALFVIGVGSQFPDLIDKPLAHLFFILPNGRVGAHSLPIAIPIGGLALVVAWKLNRTRAGGLFVFAYGTHLIADYYKVLLSPNPRLPTGLLWPLIAASHSRLEPQWAGPNSINVILWSLFSAIVLVLGLVRLLTVYRAEYSENS